MLTPALERSSPTSVTASGSRRPYSCKSSFDLRAPRTLQDVLDVQVDAGEQFINLLVSIRFIQGILARQCLRIFCLVFGKIVLKISTGFTTAHTRARSWS
jgi:hypothetical protein